MNSYLDMFRISETESVQRNLPSGFPIPWGLNGWDSDYGLQELPQDESFNEFGKFLYIEEMD